MHRVLSAAALLALVAAPCRAGAWLQAPGGSYLKLSWLSQSADERWDCRGAMVPADANGRFEQWQLFAYGEYGLREWITLVGSWAYKDQRIAGDVEYGTRSFGDLHLGARLPLSRGKRPISFEGSLSIPTYERSSLSDPPALRAQVLPSGSGRVEGEARLLAGASLWPLPLYANASAGYRLRGGEYEDQWLGALELGGSAEHFFAKAELSVQLPLRERCLGDEEAVGTVALGERLLAASLEAAFRVRASYWLGMGYAHPLAGRHSLVGGMFQLSLARWAG